MNNNSWSFTDTLPCAFLTVNEEGGSSMSWLVVAIYPGGSVLRGRIVGFSADVDKSSGLWVTGTEINEVGKGGFFEETEANSISPTDVL